MLVKFGSLIVDGKGTIGGYIVQRGRSGTIVRVKKSPIQPLTQYQLDVRNYFKQCQNLYNTLNAKQVQDWNTFADNMPITNYFGDVRYLSGQQMFMYCAMNFYLSGMQPLINAPTDTSHPNNISLQSFINRTNATILQFSDILGPYDLLHIRVTRPLKPSLNYFEDKFVSVYNSRPAGGYIDETDYYTYRFGAKTEGYKIILEWKTVSTINGQTSTIQRLSSIIDPA